MMVPVPKAKGQKPKIVIVGAGFAGLRTARGLSKLPADITVIDKSNHHLFQPLLYQVATAGLSPANIASPIRSLLREQINTRVIMAEVNGIDTQNQNVLLTQSDPVPYDYLVLATGATHSYFSHPEWAEFAPGLKTLEDAVNIRRRVLQSFELAETEKDPIKRQELLTFVLIGAGPTGVEMAGAICELAYRALAIDFRQLDPRLTRVLLLEAGPRILATFPESLSRKALRMLERLGAEVRTGARVEKVEMGRVLVNGEWISANTLLWTAGVKASPIGDWLSVEIDKMGRVVTTPELTVPGFPNIYVIGDAAHVSGKNGAPLPGVAPVAMQQGNFVAKQIEKRIDEKEAPLVKFRYFDKGNLATVGRKFAVAAVGNLRLSGFVAWVAWLVVHIYYLIGFRNRLLVLIEWAWAYLTFQRGARLITDPYGKPNKDISPKVE